MKRSLPALLLLLLASTAQAQYDAGATVGMGQGLVLNNSAIGSNVMGEVILKQGQSSHQGGAHEQASATHLAALQFQSSSEVSQAVLDRIARQFGGRQPDSYRQALVREGMLAKFNAMLQQYGYSNHNVADAFTAYLAMSWEVVNNRSIGQNRAGIDAVRHNLQQALARNPRFVAMPDAQKQEMAETFGYLAMIASSTRNELQRKSDPASLAKLQDGVNGTAQKMGVDLRAIKLTPQGFVAL
ncbi:DUF6683 family protein [Dyella sp. 2RAB6]|uniref:DUF6683 family protein n=1 Tax=Dyella sp. 2RAB6 TaxID=3232992 RepID=UPI003F926A9C